MYRSRADIKAVLDALVDKMEYEVARGNKIHLERLGYFQLTLTCPPIKSAKDIRAESIKFKSVAFRSEISFKKRFQFIKIERTPLKYHSSKLSEIEFAGLLTLHFLDYTTLTRAAFQRINRYDSYPEIEEVGRRWQVEKNRVFPCASVCTCSGKLPALKKQ